MKILGKREKTVCVGIECDICGSRCTGDSDAGIHGEVMEYATLEARWGYFSRKDLDQCQAHFCEDCYDRIVEFIETLGGKVRVREYSPGEAFDRMLAEQEDFKLENNK
jgi:hypothetical protein